MSDRVGCGDETRCVDRLAVTPANATWKGTDYERVSLAVSASTDTGTRSTATVNTTVYRAGDVTGDGVVDIFDAVAIGRGWQASRGDGRYTDAGDLNNDGTVDIRDAAVLGRNWRDG